MKILVTLKRTPDTETKIKLTSDFKKLDHTSTKFIINPYDEHAIEEALQIKEKTGNCEVVVVSFGPEGNKELIIKGLAMGADRGLLVSDEGLDDLDSLAVAKVLAAVVKEEKPDLIIGGKQAIDDDNMHTNIMLAELLNYPHVNVANKLSLDKGKGRAEREVEGGQIEVYDFNLPAVVGANKAMNTPRYTSVPGIMKAKKKPLATKKVADLGLKLEDLKNGISTVIRSYEYPPVKPSGKLFKGEDVSVMVERVVRLLREEAKVI
ncbi:MAG: electron transfer flavoprotein subunit beta/FixA family protein [Oligoflexales bacterium]|nr:electron transfer flavoprotein subunit beta/FixA family protein [Oligoflexales bacterium]